MTAIGVLLGQGIDFATNPKYTRWISPVLLAFDAVLCGLIIWKVPCMPCCFLHLFHLAPLRLIGITDTEIDWEAYMQQVQQYVSGERDYTKIKGGTGPLVYPAAHVYIYTALYWITNQGKDIFVAQMIFGFLYLLALAVVMACYRQAKVNFHNPSVMFFKRRIADFVFLGPTLHISSACPFEKIAQHFCPSVLQRLLRSFLLVGSNLCIPTQVFHDWEHRVQLGSGNQDVTSSCTPGSRCCTPPGSWSRNRYAASVVNGTTADRHSSPISPSQLERILKQGV